VRKEVVDIVEFGLACEEVVDIVELDLACEEVDDRACEEVINRLELVCGEIVDMVELGRLLADSLDVVATTDGGVDMEGPAECDGEPAGRRNRPPPRSPPACPSGVTVPPTPAPLFPSPLPPAPPLNAAANLPAPPNLPLPPAPAAGLSPPGIVSSVG